LPIWRVVALIEHGQAAVYWTHLLSQLLDNLQIDPEALGSIYGGEYHAGRFSRHFGPVVDHSFNEARLGLRKLLPSRSMPSRYRAEMAESITAFKSDGLDYLEQQLD